LDQEYYKLSYQHTWYKPLSKTFTLMLNGEAGIAGSYGSSDFPFFKNFYAGGVNSVRGFDTSAIGPRDTQTVGGITSDYAVGGTRRVVGNAEVLFPVPYLKDNKAFRLSAFIDAGSVWGETSGTLASSCSGGSDCMRFSTGAGISWQSPFGPIKLVYAVPLNDKPADKTQSIQFSFGTGF
jgi:outer membrane protein insertion porin family